MSNQPTHPRSPGRTIFQDAHKRNFCPVFRILSFYKNLVSLEYSRTTNFPRLMTLLYQVDFKSTLHPVFFFFFLNNLLLAAFYHQKAHQISGNQERKLSLHYTFLGSRKTASRRQQGLPVATAVALLCTVVSCSLHSSVII